MRRAPSRYGKLGDYLVVPNSKVALAYVWRDDNQGPAETASEVIADHGQIAADFPGARAEKRHRCLLQTSVRVTERSAAEPAAVAPVRSLREPLRRVMV